LARAKGDVAGAGGAACGISAGGALTRSGEAAVGRGRARRSRGNLIVRSHPRVAAKSNNRRPPISTTCRTSSISVSGITRSRTWRFRIRVDVKTSSQVVRSTPPVIRAISRSVFGPSSRFDRGSNSGE
jgi:hypothetical protein